MPQATPELRLLWDWDTSRSQLSNNFIERSGIIEPKSGYSPTEKDYSAIDYLCHEWDYEYTELIMENNMNWQPIEQLPKNIPDTFDVWVSYFNENGLKKGYRITNCWLFDGSILNGKEMNVIRSVTHFMIIDPPKD